MAWLLIDNSNSRTKFALGDAERILDWRAVIPTPELSHASLAETLGNLEFSAAMVCSVVPKKAEILREFLEPRGPVYFLGHSSPLGLEIDYPLPAQIGADRLANAAGVLTRHGAPAVIIDFGTAVTFDVISAQPAYCGGVIAPGLGAMSGYLPGKTALLPIIELEEPASAIGKSTEHAMQAGAVFGYRGLVKEIISRICSELGGSPKIIATGGDAAVIARGVDEIDAVDADITLDGLRQVAARVFLPMKDWEAHYQAGDTPWDRGEAAPPLLEIMERHGTALWGGGPVLVPGCGTGHDVRALASTGIPTVGLDIAVTALEKAREMPCTGPTSYELGDFLDPAWRSGKSFSAIWEHTCFCAIPPHQRGAYAQSAAALLPSGGMLVGVFYLTPRDPGDERDGPPFGCSIEELEQTFGKWFERIDGWVPQRAYPDRVGREWIGIFRKLP